MDEVSLRSIIIHIIDRRGAKEKTGRSKGNMKPDDSRAGSGRSKQEVTSDKRLADQRDAFIR